MVLANMIVYRICEIKNYLAVPIIFCILDNQSNKMNIVFHVTF